MILNKVYEQKNTKKGRERERKERRRLEEKYQFGV